MTRASAPFYFALRAPRVVRAVLCAAVVGASPAALWWSLAAIAQLSNGFGVPPCDNECDYQPYQVEFAKAVAWIVLASFCVVNAPSSSRVFIDALWSAPAEGWFSGALCGISVLVAIVAFVFIVRLHSLQFTNIWF